ncbi:MAG: amino acid ABC transporter permease [Pseudomonadota bacterium]
MAIQDTAGTAPATKSSSSSWVYDPKVRSIASQVALVAFIIWVGYSIVENTAANLERQNIASGFGFLSTTAGFGIGQTLIDYAENSTYGRTFVVGVLNTILVSVIGIALATILGFIVGVARLSSNWVVERMATVYVEVLRNLPLLLQIFFWYSATLLLFPNPRNAEQVLGFVGTNRGIFMPKPVWGEGSSLIVFALIIGIIAAFGLARWAKARQMKTGQPFPVFWSSIGLILGLPLVAFVLAGFPLTWDVPELRGFNYSGGVTVIPEFMALLLALSFYTGAFIAEIVRAGILAVSHGQTEASYALGLRPGPTLRLVVIPQAMRVIIPPLTSQYLNLTKNSSLAVAIAYPDLVSVFAGTTLNQTGQAVEIILMTMAVYLTLSLLTSAFMNWYNSRMALVER